MERIDGGGVRLTARGKLIREEERNFLLLCVSQVFKLFCQPERVFCDALFEDPR